MVLVVAGLGLVRGCLFSVLVVIGEGRGKEGRERLPLPLLDVPRLELARPKGWRSAAAVLPSRVRDSLEAHYAIVATLA